MLECPAGLEPVLLTAGPAEGEVERLVDPLVREKERDRQARVFAPNAVSGPRIPPACPVSR